MKGQKVMNYSIEEMNLMCIYECNTRQGMISELEAAIEYVDDPEMLHLIDQTLEKLYHTTDQEFIDLAPYPTWDEDGGADDVVSV